jgi:single-stranded-DNA-specific exonuclease
MEKTKVVGVTFDGRQDVIAGINEMVDKLVAIREPENPHDANAIGVFVEKLNGERKSVGYINRGLAAKLALEMDAGKELVIHEFFITGLGFDGIAMGIIFNYSLEEPLKNISDKLYGEVK